MHAFMLPTQTYNWEGMLCFLLKNFVTTVMRTAEPHGEVVKPCPAVPLTCLRVFLG